MGLFLGGRWAVVSVALGVVAGCVEAPRVAEQEGDAQVAFSAQALTSSDCPAGYNLIQGTSGNDTLQGTAGNDCIIGLGGNDTLYGNGGTDYIAGGNGDDFIYGGDANDQLFGEAGVDRIEGQAGNDSIDGGTGNDPLYGGDGNDTILGGGNSDSIWGDAGADVIDGEAANDTIDGGLGNDTINGGDADDVLHGGADNDLIHGDGGIDQLYGDDGNDVLDGDAQADTLWGGAGDDVLYGDLANDTLRGEAGDDALIGGAGTNVIDGGTGTDACTGTGCEKPELALSGCTLNSQCSAGKHCIADFGLCIGCVSDQDNDAVCDSADGCPTDAGKVAPGVCGCGVADTDSDNDGTPNCNDGCPSDPAKIAPGVCGCGVADTDGDGVCDPVDICPAGDDHVDTDGDGTPNACDQTPIGCVAGATGAAIFTGNAVVDGVDTAGDLAQLAGKVCVTGNLTVNGTTLTNLIGLSALKDVAGAVTIGNFSPPGNTQLTSLDGLQQLKSAGSVLIANNFLLTNLTGLSGFQKATSSFSLRGNIGLTSLNGLQSLSQVVSLSINGSNQLTDLAALSGVTGQLWSLNIDSNYGLQSLNGLQGVTRVTDTLTLWGGAMEDLSALSGLTSVGTLEVAHQQGLESLNGLQNVATVTWALKIHHNAHLTSLAALSPSALTSLSNQITIYSNQTLLTCEIDTLLSQTTKPCTACTGNDTHICNCPGAGGDTDGDGTCNPQDQCASDPAKVAPGACGCGVADTDGDNDGTPNCNDGCASDPAKIAAGACGCGVADTDGDDDGTPNCNDGCASDPAKVAAGVCGCGVADTDGDNDGTPNCNDGCASDPAKVAPGACGCGVADTDGDNDGTANCNDGCVSDPAKVAPGVCGCGVADTDGDNDGTPNCNDACASDPAKVAPGICGCGIADADSDNDGALNCNDGCVNDPAKTAPGACGCGVADTDSDGDGTPNCNDGCPNNAPKTAPGVCGCGVADTDSDGDGTPNCNDACPNNAPKTAPGICGCAVLDTDSDGDGTPNCNDGCATDPAKTSPGSCGCFVAETDSDADGTPNCVDVCEFFSDSANADSDSKPDGCDPCPTDAGDACDNLTSFALLPVPLGGESRANAVNANGRTIVGQQYDGLTYSAFRYQEGQGLTVLPPAITGSPDTDAASVSADGAIALGRTRQVGINVVYRGVRWNGAGAIAAQTTSGNHVPLWLSPNASFGLGYYLATYDSPQKYDTNLNVTASIPAGSSYSSHAAFAAADNGNPTVVNRRSQINGVWDTLLYSSTLTSPTFVAHRAGTSSQYLGDITPDGALLVGRTMMSGVDVAVTWSQSGGYATIPGLTTCADSDAVAIAKVGSVTRIVGHCDGTAYLWDGTPGARPLHAALTQMGIAVPPRTQLHLTDISRDARTLVGYGVSTVNGDERGFVVHLGNNYDVLPCSQSHSDGDGVANCYDACPTDSGKTAAGICGCGVADTDSDADGTPNCQDSCPNNAPKTSPGICGCAVADTDSDGDGTPNCNDSCPNNAPKTAPGQCGCAVADTDSDADGTPNCNDLCPNNAPKTAPGICGCAVADTDSDGDSTPNCNDGCANDPVKVAPGICGCGVADTDGDFDGTADCNDGCLADPAKVAPGQCGCGVADTDGDGDGTADCNDLCPGFDDALDADDDGIPDGCDTGPQGCTPGASGAGIFTGSVTVGPTGVPPSALDGIWCVTGNLTIEGTDLTDLSALSALEEVAGHMAIRFNGELTSVDGLESLTKVGATLWISDNAVLANLAGLANLTHVMYLYDDALIIRDNASLPGCWAWLLAEQLSVEPNEIHCGSLSVACSGNTGVGSCGELPPNFVCDMNAEGPGVFDGSISLGSGYPYGPPVSVEELGGLTCVTGDLSISDTELTDLSALSSLQGVGGALSISYNLQLESLDGLENLTSIGYGLSIETNHVLADLSGLSGLESLGALNTWGSPWLMIRDNAMLPGCWSWLIEQQLDVTCGTSYMRCNSNTGTGSCGELPPGFVCQPGAEGPGVYDNSISLGGYPLGPPVAAADLGGLTCVTGDLSISSDILTDLSAFSTLQYVGGGLSIRYNTALESLHGLENLVSIGYGLSIETNQALTDLSGLSGLESLGANYPWGPPWFVIRDNAMLPGCWSWLIARQIEVACGTQYMPCNGNTGVGSCGELPPGFECEPGAEGPGVYEGSISLGSGGFPFGTPVSVDELGGLTCVTGNLSISNTALTDLSALSSLQGVGGDLSIQYNTELESLDGLENLTSVGYGLSIETNQALTDLSGLSALESLGAQFPWGTPWFMIRDNAMLPGCWSWLIAQQLETACGTSYMPCNGNTGVGSCGALPPGFVCQPGAEGPGVYEGSLSIGSGGYPLGTPVSIDELGGLTCVTGNLSISGTELTDLSALSTLQYVGGDLSINYNAQLESLDGLENLTSVGYGLQIETNQALTDLSALSGLDSLGAQYPWGTPWFMIRDNAMLPGCWSWLLPQQVDVACGTSYMPCTGNTGTGSCGELPPGFVCEPGAEGPGVYQGTLSIEGYGYPYAYTSPVSIGELGGLTCVTGDLSISNTELADLSPLSALQGVGGYLYMHNNSELLTVDGLENLTSIGYGLSIENNAVLSDLQGFSGLESLGALYPWGAPMLNVRNNPALPGCWWWDLEQRTDVECGTQWMSCEGNTGAGSCGDLPPDFVCDYDAEGPGVYPGDLGVWDVEEVDGLRCVAGDLNIVYSPLTDLSGLSSLQGVAGRLYIQSMYALVSLDGLENLTHIGGDLLIQDNHVLTSLAGLSSVTSLGELLPEQNPTLRITNNTELPACWVDVIEAQANVSCGYDTGGGFQECTGNTGSGTCEP